MFPNTSPQPPVPPTGLPPAQVGQRMQPPVPSAPVAPPSASEAAVAEAKHLAAQYAHNPRQFSEALGQLKANYIASQFGVNVQASEQ